MNCGFSSTTVPGRPGGSSVIRTAIRSVRQGLKRSRDDRTDSADTAEWVIFRFPSSKLRFPVRADVTTPAARSTVKLSVPTPPGVDHRVQLNPPELNPRGPRLPPGGGRPYLLLATRSSPTRLAAGVRGPPFGAALRPSPCCSQWRLCPPCPWRQRDVSDLLPARRCCPHTRNPSTSANRRWAFLSG